MSDPKNQSGQTGFVLLLQRWLKFNFVGGIGIGVQFAVLFVLKGLLHIDYLAATAMAVEAAVVHNFVWHEQFTWANRVRMSWHGSIPRFLRFNLTTGAISILGNLALMRVLVGKGHLNYLVANAIAIALCSVINFFVCEGWVFSETRNLKCYHSGGLAGGSWTDTEREL